MKKLIFWIVEAAAFALAYFGIEKDIALLGASGIAIFIVFPFYWIYMRLHEKNKETRKPSLPKEYKDYLWLQDTEDVGNRFFKAYKQDLDENDDYHMTKKEILEEYDYGEKIYKYEPFSLPFKVEDGKVYSYIKEEEWICVGRLKKTDMKKYERSTHTELHLMPNYFKKVYNDEVEADHGDSYFGVEVTLPIGEDTVN